MIMLSNSTPSVEAFGLWVRQRVEYILITINGEK